MITALLLLYVQPSLPVCLPGLSLSLCIGTNVEELFDRIAILAFESVIFREISLNKEPEKTTQLHVAGTTTSLTRELTM